MKLLTLDIEMAPNLAHVWGLWQNNVSLVQLRESQEMLCWAAKWHNRREIIWRRGSESLPLLYDLLDETDALITYNGDRYDIPHINRELIEHGLGKPSPYASIDLLKVVRGNFKFPSNKLDYVAERLVGQRKLTHPGHQLWIDVMAGDSKAWRLMERYNRRDVAITEKCYDRLLPWIKNHPSVPLHDGHVDGCPNCGSLRSERRGYMHTKVGRFQRFTCKSCKTWYRGSQRLSTTSAR